MRLDNLFHTYGPWNGLLLTIAIHTSYLKIGVIEKRLLLITPAVFLMTNGLSLAQVASGCYDRNDAGPAWMKGYHDAQRDFQGLNGHGFDDSTHLADKENYQGGYQTGWNDAQKGVNGPFC